MGLHKDLTGADLHVPKPHAGTHEAAGTDPLVLVESQVTGLAAALADSAALYVIPKLLGAETYWDAAINRAIITAATQHKKVLLTDFYAINAPIILTSGTIIEGADGSCGLNALHVGAVIKKDPEQTSINWCTLFNFKIGSVDDDAIFLDMDGINNSIIRRVTLSTSYGIPYRKNKIGIRFINACYYNNVEDCILGGCDVGILFDATAATGSNENNVTGCSLPSNNTGIQINSFSASRHTNSIRVLNCSMETNILAINCNGAYCYFTNNRYENCSQGIRLDTLSMQCELSGGVFYATDPPYEDLGTYNKISAQLVGVHPTPLKTYDNIFNYLLNPDFNNIVGGIPEYWTVTATLAAAADTAFVAGVRTLKLTIPSGASGVVKLNQVLPTALRSMLLGTKYLKAVVYNASAEISNLRVLWNSDLGLMQSSAHGGDGWEKLEFAGTFDSAPAWTDVSIQMTAATTANRAIYIALISLTDHSDDCYASWFAPYINRYGDTMQAALKVMGALTATQLKLSALNTAPANAGATGTLGEIRVTADAIYVCTATNTWVKAALATWA